MMDRVLMLLSSDNKFEFSQITKLINVFEDLLYCIPTSISRIVLHNVNGMEKVSQLTVDYVYRCSRVILVL